MSKPKSISDEEFVQLVRTLGPSRTAKTLGMTERYVYARRRECEAYFGEIVSPKKAPPKEYDHRQTIDIKNGSIIVASDLHILPGCDPVCLKALKKLTRELEPIGVVLNGDVLDFPGISRHPPIGWEGLPDVQEEIEAAQGHLGELEQLLTKRGAIKIWNLGNHDARFETRLAAVASEYGGVKGIHLGDHFPTWRKAWSCWINDSVVIKHRFKGGVHATHNNTMWAGKTIVTGHLHSQKITPFTDYNGTRYGVDTGCVADTDQQSFVNYTEDNPLNWRSGFCVLTFHDGELLYPELVTRWSDTKIQFRGKLITV